MQPGSEVMKMSSRDGPMAKDARQFGARIAEGIIEHFGVCISDEQVAEAVAKITGEVLHLVRGMWETGLPAKLAISWGDECMNGLQERLLEHMEYLKVAAALVRFDPSDAMGNRDTGQ
jgi:hypothetical protein